MPRRGKITTRTPKQFVSNEVQKKSNMETSSTKPIPTEYAIAGHSSHTMEVLKNEEKHCDAVIEAGGEKFKIHKSVFAIYSDYFDKIFTVEMQEKYDSVVKLESTRSDVMKCIVDFIYSGQLSINSENAVELLVAADYLRIEKIKEFSVRFLLQNVNAESCVGVWICAKTYDLRDLLEKSAIIFGANLTSVAEEELCWLDNDQFLEIMESTKQRRNSEEESFTVAVIWTKYDQENRKETFCKLFQSFDLSCFSRNFLSNITRKESLITASVELLHKIVAELMARLEKGSDEEEKNKRRIAELEEDKQASAKKIDQLQCESKRLTERAQDSVSYSEQAQNQYRTASRTITSLTNQRKLLTKQLELSEEKFQHAELQLKTSAKTVECLTNKNQRLSTQVEKMSSQAHYVERQERIFALKIDKFTAENKQLSEQLHQRTTAFQQAEKQQKASVRKYNYLTEENIRLTDRVQKSVNTSQQHETHQKVLATRNDELTLENKELIERVQRNMNHVQQVDLQMRETRDNNQRLFEENKLLSEQIDVYSNAAEQAEDQRKELEIKADNFADKNQLLAIQLEIETLNAQKAANKVHALEKKIVDYVEKNQGLFTSERKWSSLNEQIQSKFVTYILKVNSAAIHIRSLMNDPSKLSFFRLGIHLTNDDRTFINNQLKRFLSTP